MHTHLDHDHCLETVVSALWQLRLDSELVYTGDAGSTEAGRASNRRGVEFRARWKLNANWFLEDDAAWSRARFRGAAPEGEGNFIDNPVAQVTARWTF